MWVRGWDKVWEHFATKIRFCSQLGCGKLMFSSQMGSTESQLRLRSVCLCTAGRPYRFQKDISDIHGVHGPGLRWNLRVARELSNVPNGPEKRHRTTGISIWKAYEVGSTRSSDTLKRVGVMRFKITCHYGKLVIIPISQPTIALGISIFFGHWSCYTATFGFSAPATLCIHDPCKSPTTKAPTPSRPNCPTRLLQISVAKEWTWAVNRIQPFSFWWQITFHYRHPIHPEPVGPSP